MSCSVLLRERTAARGRRADESTFPTCLLALSLQWQYTNQVPTAEEGWRSAMATPRLHHVTNATRIGYVLKSEPYQIETVRNSSLLPDGAESASIVNTTVEIDLSNNLSGAVYFALNITIPDGANVSETAAITLTMRSSASNETLLAGHILGGSNAGTTWVDRGKLTGFEHPLFTDKFSVANAGNAESLSGIFDRSLFEIFVNGGEFQSTSTVFPSETLDTLEVTTTDLPEGADVSAAVWGLRSTWAQQ